MIINIMKKSHKISGWLGLCFCLLQAGASLFAQNTATVAGRITDASNEQPVELVTVYVKGGNTAVTSDESGKFAIQVPADQRLVLGFRRVAYKESSADILPLAPGARFVLDVALAPTESNLEVVIQERRLDDWIKAGDQRRDDIQQHELRAILASKCDCMRQRSFPKWRTIKRNQNAAWLKRAIRARSHHKHRYG